MVEVCGVFVLTSEKGLELPVGVAGCEDVLCAEFLEQVLQFFVIPLTFDAVQCDVEQLFLLFVEVYDCRLCLRVAEVEQDVVPLVPADEVARPKVHDERLHEAPPADRCLERLVFLFTGLELPPWVVGRRFHVCELDALDVHAAFLLSGMKKGRPGFP